MNGKMFGYTVYISWDTPKMQLSADCPVTDAFRAEINAWMIEFFGMVNTVPDGEAYVIDLTKRIHMNQRTFAAMKHELIAAGVNVPQT